MRHRVLMRKLLNRGAWNVDVWLQYFPMSLADRSFDSDGNCVALLMCMGESKPVSLGGGEESAEVGGGEGFTGLTDGSCGRATSLKNVAVSSFQRFQLQSRRKGDIATGSPLACRPDLAELQLASLVEPYVKTISSDSVS